MGVWLGRPHGMDADGDRDSGGGRVAGSRRSRGRRRSLAASWLFSVRSRSLAFRTIELVRQKWPWRRPRFVPLSATAPGVGGASATLTRTVARPTALEDRVSRLEIDVLVLEAQRATDQRQVDERLAAVVHRQDATDARIAQDRSELRQTIAEATGARAPIHLWGVWPSSPVSGSASHRKRSLPRGNGSRGGCGSS
jgi:hypothetical protein